MITKQEFEQGIRAINKMLENGEITIETFIRFHEVLDLDYFGDVVPLTENEL